MHTHRRRSLMRSNRLMQKKPNPRLPPQHTNHHNSMLSTAETMMTRRQTDTTPATPNPMRMCIPAMITVSVMRGTLRVRTRNGRKMTGL